MLARLTGLLESLTGNEALIAVDEGRAYQVLVPAYLAARLGGGAGGVGSEITLHTIEYLESLNQGSSFVPRLIGFATPGEREFFELSTTVKGLGNKRALRAMALEPASIARSIHERDTRALQRLPEIGPKLAELIVHELKGKVEAYTRGGPGAVPVTGPVGGVGGSVEAKPDAAVANGAAKKPRVRLGAAAGSGEPAAERTPEAVPPIRQTVETLIALGEMPVEAERMVARAIDRARAAGAAAPATASELIAAAYSAR